MTSEVEQKIIEMPVSNLAGALCKAQGMMSGAKKDKKNPFFKSNYADLASVFDAIREPFAANGLSISQPLDIIGEGKQIICTRLMHISGEFIESKMLLPNESNPQKLGSLLTYYRRYMLMAIAGIPAEDDDGNQASGRPTPPVNYISAKQVSDLEVLINGHDKIRKMLLKNCSGSLASITVDRYPGAVQWIKELVEKENG